MNKVLLIIMSLLLINCGRARLKVSSLDSGCIATEVEEGTIINCGDGDFLIEDGQDGSDGKDGVDGIDGQPGEDAVVLTKTTVTKGSCTEVSPGIYVENIKDGKLFDVYLNDKCQDNLGEYCDNVIPSFGRSGQLNESRHPGSATVCWAGNIQISGSRQGDKSLLIYVLNFN